MRGVIFKISLLVLLLSGGHNFYANKLDHFFTSSSNREISKNRQDSVSHKERNSIIVEENDFDIEEEHFGNQLKKNNKISYSHIPAESNLWNSLQLQQRDRTTKTKRLVFTSTILGQTNPLYIRFQVFRI